MKGRETRADSHILFFTLQIFVGLALADKLTVIQPIGGIFKEPVQ